MSPALAFAGGLPAGGAALSSAGVGRASATRNSVLRAGARMDTLRPAVRTGVLSRTPAGAARRVDPLPTGGLSARHTLVQERVAQFAEGRRLDLPDALLRQPEVPADAVQRLHAGRLAQVEPPRQDRLLARRQ